MKRSFSFLFFAFLFFGMSQAQVHRIAKGNGYDKLPKHVKQNTNPTIIIEGYNPFASKLNGSGKDIDLSYETPKIFTDIAAKIEAGNIGDAAKALDEEIANAKAPKPPGRGRPAPKPNPELIAELQAQRDCIGSFPGDYSNFLDALQDIYALYLIEDRIKKIITDPEIDKPSAETNIEAYINAVSPGDDPRQFIKKLLTNLKESHAKMKVCYDELSKTLEPETLTLAGKIEDSKKGVAIVIKDASTSVERKKFFKEEMAYATKKLEQLMVDTTWTNILTKVASGMDLRTQVLATPWELSYTVGDIKEDGKEIELTVTNLKKETIYSYGKFEFLTYGQLKVDISSGYLISFSGDENYARVPDATGKIIGLRKQSRNVGVHSIGALFHFYNKTQKGIAFGGTGGFSLPIDGRINFYAGGSILFNKKARFVISGGLSYASVKHLETGHLEETTSGTYEYNFINPNDTEVRYNLVHRLKPFLSLTYNLATLANN